MKDNRNDSDQYLVEDDFQCNTRYEETDDYGYEYRKTYRVTEIADEYPPMSAKFLNSYLAKNGFYDRRSLDSLNRDKVLKPKFLEMGLGEVIHNTVQGYKFTVFTEAGREYIKDMIDRDIASGAIGPKPKTITII